MAKWKKRLAGYFLAAIAILLIIGYLLDIEAERVIEQLYPRDSYGIIKGHKTKSYIAHRQQAVILIHGFLESPNIFISLFNDQTLRKFADIYIPLLPFHSRNLTESKKFSNKFIMDKMAKYINKIAASYKKVTIIGLSYGGTIALQLAKKINCRPIQT